jgi:hypothetical protein
MERDPQYPAPLLKKLSGLYASARARGGSATEIDAGESAFSSDVGLSYAARLARGLPTAAPVGGLLYQGAAANVADTERASSATASLLYHLTESNIARLSLFFADYGTAITQYGLKAPHLGNGATALIGDGRSVLNLLYAGRLEDTWTISERLSVSAGVRVDWMSGFAQGFYLSPTISAVYRLFPSAALRISFARFSELAGAASETGAVQSSALQQTKSSLETTAIDQQRGNDYWRAGVEYRLRPGLSLSQTSYFRLGRHYLDDDAGGFTLVDVPSQHATAASAWGVASAMRWGWLGAGAWMTRDQDSGTRVDRFDFTPIELAGTADGFILPHAPIASGAGGVTYRWGGFLTAAQGALNVGFASGLTATAGPLDARQVSLGSAHDFLMPLLGWLRNDLVLTQILDSSTLSRPLLGSEIFRAAFGRRFTLFDEVSFALPWL